MDPTERLPPEILRKIIWDLPKSYYQGTICGLRWKKTFRLSTLATVSRRWQQLIEPFLFRDLHLRIDKVLESRYVTCLTPQRLLHVRNVTAKCVLASHICKQPKRFLQPHGDCDFRQHHPGDEREFSEFVERVLGILKDLPRREKPYVELVFEMSCSGSRAIFTQKGMQYMELFDTWRDFPELPMISVFKACGSTDTPTFTPGDMCRLASKMPRLEKFGVRAIESIRDYVYGDALIRNGLAKSLDLLPISVQTLLIDYQRERIPDQTFEPPSIMATDSDVDDLSEAVQRLTQRHGLREIILLASIDSAIFQPTKENACWPTLESFKFAFCDVLPSGEWVVTGENPLPAEEEERQRQETREWATDGIYCPPGCEIENSFKSGMKEAVMDRFLVAAANAVCHMPKIKKLSVRHVFDPTDFEEDISRAGFSFSTAKGLMVLGKTDIPVLSSEVLEAWRAATKTHDVVFDRCLTNELEVAGRYANEFGPEFQWDHQDVYLF
ncbi:hypothetical protein FPCIR_11417 [Fusarium pseudocircinatum]|uniref:F-box domain-containing protein n=1 Tax=Fusarium pseudocircinatum TaxID=56676 RepID=A0A8H5KVK0_9HYPO|nr:hypothetical protein FPCIR_11417 [Fusarium pseudocircinatum]